MEYGSSTEGFPEYVTQPQLAQSFLINASNLIVLRWHPLKIKRGKSKRRAKILFFFDFVPNVHIEAGLEKLGHNYTRYRNWRPNGCAR